MTANGGIVESADATLLSEYQHFLAGKWRINHCNYEKKWRRYFCASRPTAMPPEAIATLCLALAHLHLPCSFASQDGRHRRCDAP